ncbi:MAG: hypothetical protein ACT4OT_08815 [Acidobacteriota bacterium]
MKTKLRNLLRALPGLTVALLLTTSAVVAQPAPAPTKSPDAKTPKEATKAAKPTKTESVPTSATTGEDAGDYTMTSTLEFGYRGIHVGGDVNKFKSDLNYKAGPRLFDSSLLLQAKDSKGGFFDSLLVTSTGWGADPSGNVRIRMEKPQAYRFDGNYRRFKYYRVLNNIVNPVWSFGLQPNPVSGFHSYNTRTQMGDFDLTILPKNEIISFNIGYSPERYTGPFFTTYSAGGNQHQLLANARSRANDFRVGAEGKLGPIDWTFLQGFRRFRDDTFTDTVPLAINPASTAARLTSYARNEPSKGSVDFTRASLHTLVAKKLDLTARIVYSKADSSFAFVENFTGVNWNPRVTGWPPTAIPRVPGPGTVTVAGTPNTLNLGQYNITGKTERPSILFDFGATFLATDNFRLSNTFRVEDWDITGTAVFADFFSITRNLPATAGGGTSTDTVGFSNLDATEITRYRKYQNTFEGDYQFSNRLAIHFGHRYGQRKIERFFDGFNLGSQGSLTPPNARSTHLEIFDNHTHAFFAGFKARPAKEWTVYLDVEHGTADNAFTRIGNYDYTNLRAKSRYVPNRKVILNLGMIVRNNANPSEIAGVTLTNFGVSYKTRIFTSSLDIMPNSRLMLNLGYNYNWVNSESLIDYSYLSSTNSAIRGTSWYYVRNNFFFIESTSRLTPRVTFYSAYRVNKDNGQGNRVSDPLATGARTLITSYPMSFQSPEARLSIKLNRRLDWNFGYQYFNYNEDGFQRTFAGTPRAQNYHAHLPYMSLRLYFGRKE